MLHFIFDISEEADITTLYFVFIILYTFHYCVIT